MVNPFKGEVLVEDDEGKRYKFVFGMYAQVVLEETVHQSWGQFWARAKDWSATDVLNLFSAGLARHHESMSKRDVADLMDRLGPSRCSELVNEAVNKAMPLKTEQETPEPEHEEDAKGNAHPPPPTTKKVRTAPQATTM